MDFLPFIKVKDTPTHQKWGFVCETMKPHTQGTCPEHIFIERRPLESAQPYALSYRKNNYKPTTKSPFDLAIDAYIEVAQHIDVKVNYEEDSENVKEYIDNYFQQSGLQLLNLKEWTIQVPGRYRQTDPNAVVVVMPKHEQEILADYREEIPDFNSLVNKEIDVEIRIVNSCDIKYLAHDAILFKAGDWKYSERHSKEWFIGLDKEAMYIIYPKKTGDQIEYIQHGYYSNNLEQTPIISIACALVWDGETHYYLPDYWGAGAWGDKYIAQDSDLGICEARHTYIEKVRLRTKCKAPGCVPSIDGKYRIGGDNGDICTSCNGSGYVADTGPLGTHWVDRGELDPDGAIKSPILFVEPPTGVLEHSANRTEYYYMQMRKELNIIDQNFTDQSGVSKSYDVAQKVTKVTNIVKDIFRIYDNILNLIAEYRGYKPEIYVNLPEDFDIMNKQDTLIWLSELKKSGAPYLVLLEATKKYMLKEFGQTEQNKKIIDFLGKVNKLLVYGTNDLQTAKAVFGGDISAKDLAINAFGFQVAKEIVDEDPEITTEALMSEFNTRIAPFISQPTVQLV